MFFCRGRQICHRTVGDGEEWKEVNRATRKRVVGSSIKQGVHKEGNPPRTFCKGLNVIYALQFGRNKHFTTFVYTI
jgi:hypothetical protein